MCFLQLEPAEVHLKGISRGTSFTIRNPNEFLAVSYDLLFSSPSTKLSLFPEKGILLTGQSQKITIKYIGNTFESSLDVFSETVLVRYTFKIQYNRALMMKKQMNGWQQIPQQIQKSMVEVHVGGQKEAIEQYIKEDIIFNQEFSKSKLNLSEIKESKHKSFINQDSFENLEIDSKIQDNGGFDLQKKTSKTGFQLPFQQICPLQYGESKADNPNKGKSSMMRYQMVQSKIVKDINQSFEIEMKTVQNHDFSDSYGSDMKDTTAQSSSRGGELVVLAIIAAFFVALGNNFRRIFG